MTHTPPPSHTRHGGLQRCVYCASHTAGQHNTLRAEEFSVEKGREGGRESEEEEEEKK